MKDKGWWQSAFLFYICPLLAMYAVVMLVWLAYTHFHKVVAVGIYNNGPYVERYNLGE